MKFVLLITLCVATINCVSKSECPIYNCSGNAPSTDTGACASKSDSNGEVTFTFNKCGSNHACLTTAQMFMSTGVTVNCTPTSTMNSVTDFFKDAVDTIKDAGEKLVGNECDTFLLTATGRVDGQKCSKNSNCYDVLECDAGVCKGKANGVACSNARHCANGYTCIGSVCAMQRNSGETCTNEYDCKNSMSCGNNKCVSYNSVADGMNVNTVTACVSGLALPKVTAGAVTYDCDSYAYESNDCTGANDKCSYKWNSAGTVQVSACACKTNEFNGLQERMCAEFKNMVSTTYNDRQTSLRFTKDINLCGNKDSTDSSSYGTCIDNVFASTVFIRNSIFVILSVLAILF